MAAALAVNVSDNDGESAWKVSEQRPCQCRPNRGVAFLRPAPGIDDSVNGDVISAGDLAPSPWVGIAAHGLDTTYGQHAPKDFSSRIILPLATK